MLRNLLLCYATHLFKVPRGPWTWAAHSVDELQDILRCSSVVIEGEGKAENSTFMMRMTYGYGGYHEFTKKIYIFKSKIGNFAITSDHQDIKGTRCMEIMLRNLNII